MNNIEQNISNLIDSIVKIDAKSVIFHGSISSDDCKAERCTASIEVKGEEEFTLEFKTQKHDFKSVGNGISASIELDGGAYVSIERPDYVYTDEQREGLMCLLSKAKTYKFFCEDIGKFSRKNVTKRINELLETGLIKWEKTISEEIELDEDIAVLEKYKAEYGDEVYEYSALRELELLENFECEEDDGYEYDFYRMVSPLLKVEVGTYYSNIMYFLNDDEITQLFHSKKACLTYDDVLVRTDNKRCINLDHKLSEVKATVIIRPRTTLEKKEINIEAYYCNDCKRHYILESEFERIKKFGIICTKIVDLGDLTTNGNASWAEESKLKQMGYTVSQKDNLSSMERRLILNQAIYNKVMERDEIIDFLKWLVSNNSNRNNMRVAIKKWNEDIDYLMYGDRPDPDDFIIGTIFLK